MTDTKDLLAQASVALDAERAASAQAYAALKAQNDSLSSANIALQAQLDTANATIASLKAATDPWAAVDKTGATDVTAQVQALWDKGLAMPAGKYLIDAVKGLKANGAVKLDPQAILLVKPNAAERYCAVDVGDNASLTGGQIIGDRDAHTYTAGSTHEHGYGVRLSGNGAKITGTRITGCTGDGLDLIGTNYVVDGVVCTGNRRNNCSVFGGTTGEIKNSEFSNAGNGSNPDPAGLIGPFAGIDVEPDKAATTSVTLTNNKLLNNAHAGLCAWLRSEVGGSMSVTAKNNTITGNANGIHAKALAGSISLTVSGNTLTNKSCNCRVETGSTFAIDGNTMALVGKTRTPQTIMGLSTVNKYDIQFPVTTGMPNGKAVVGTNSYV